MFTLLVQALLTIYHARRDLPRAQVNAQALSFHEQGRGKREIEREQSFHLTPCTCFSTLSPFWTPSMLAWCCQCSTSPLSLMLDPQKEMDIVVRFIVSIDKGKTPEEVPSYTSSSYAPHTRGRAGRTSCWLSSTSSASLLWTSAETHVYARPRSLCLPLCMLVSMGLK